jgi:putative sterol carrier protein
MTPKDILENEIPSLLVRKPELAQEIGAVIRFDIGGPQGGQWTLDLTQASDWVKPGAVGSPRMTIAISDENLVKLRQGQLNPQMAALTGKLKFKPMDMALATKLGKLFG